MQGPPGASTARTGGGAGSGQPAASSERDRRARVSGHKAVLSLEPPAPGVLQSGCRCGLCGSIDNIPLCLEAGSILHDSPERSEVDLARAVCLPTSQGQEGLRRPAGFAAGGRSGFVTRRRSSETIGVFTVRLAGRAPVVSGRGGRALRTSGRECVAQGRGLKGNRASLQAQRGTRTARGEANIGGGVSAVSSAEAQTRRCGSHFPTEHRSRSRS